MFSPAPNGATPTIRTSKRRLRPLSNEGSLSAPKGKRQRLNEQTFVPPGAAPEMEETKNSMIASLARPESAGEPAGLQREIAVRGKKARSGDRNNNKGDGGSVLTSNDTYTVSKLPALPDLLRTDSTVDQHGAVNSDSGYALALTHTHAIVWPYAVNLQSPETFTFALPQPSKRASDPLPLGSLVSNSASSTEPGLVVVIPTSGKITYWESVAHAATLDLRLKRNGVELSIPGMLFGETVIQVLNAETAGFVLAFSTGRIAYMAVRDSQGRPAISVQFLRGGGGTISGSIFGSIRNALSSSASRGDIAAVRAGAIGKVGERNVVLATSKGKLQCWNIQRSGHAAINADSEGRDAIVMAIKERNPELGDSLIESFECHDFTYVPKSPTDTSTQDPKSGTRLLLLTSLKHRNISHYFLVNVVLKDAEVAVGDIHPITSYTTPVNRAATSKPRLYLPNPALIAYLVFDRAIVVVSMAKQPDSPDTQLRSEGHLLPQSFEDVIDFRQEMNLEIVGSGMEEPHGSLSTMEDQQLHNRHRAKHPAVVLIVRGGGVLRVAATDVTRLVSSNAQQVTAISKLKQAVFFGGIKDNPLNFKVRPELQFPAEDIGAAAKELSGNILKSCSPLDNNLAVGQSLQKRATALRDLAIYLQASRVVLDRKTKWQLLLNAEKLAAATLMWKRYDDTVKNLPDGKKHALMADVVEFIHENDKNTPKQEAGELDRVRHWFIEDVPNIEIAVPWAYQVIKYTFQDGNKDHASVMDILSEADDLVLGAIQGAYDFRTANLKLYGLENEQLEHGILKSGYEGLDVFWTSTYFVSENLRKQVELAGLLLVEYWGRAPGKADPAPEIVDKIRLEFPNLIDTAIRSNSERIRWNLAQDSQQSQDEAEKMAEALTKVQDELISSLSTDLELTDEAIALAEKHEILPVLARLLQYELDGSRLRACQPGISDEELESLLERSEAVKGIIQQLFSKFGAKWANALFEHEMDIGAMRQLLNEWTEEQAHLTEFLRSRSEYARVSWINDITRENDIVAASSTLLDLGYSPEKSSPELSSVSNQLGLIKIQDQIYDFVLPSIATAIDENAEIQLALEAHGNARLRKQHVFIKLLRDSMGRLVKHEAMDAPELIDLLTLIGGQVELFGQESFLGARFFLALEATRCGAFSKEQQLLMQRIIWRRCMLSDDWAQVNDSFEKDEQQLSEQLKKTAVYQTAYMCFKNRIFEKNKNMKPMHPTEVIGAGVSEVEERFSQLDTNIKENIIGDMQLEDDSLEQLREHRMEKWYNTVLEKAKEDYEAALADETEDGKSMHEMEARLALVEADIKEREQIKADGLLHSKQRYKPKPKTNGHLRQSVRA
ncbi:hypothetical protein VTL71DRAFT_11075 [Oculimacula yallundae]|uniref:Uncharacterized protein n=1 Tax=Oculimacula yallundae TaxID=86028 RepID=A0ABR4CUZ5_9HELO